MSKTTPTVRDVKRLAAKLGATVEDSEAGFNRTLYVDLPPGKVFSANLGHGLVATWDTRGGKAWRDPEIADLVESMSHGVEDGCECDDPQQCDTCNPEP